MNCAPITHRVIPTPSPRVTAFFILQINSSEFRAFHLSFVLRPCRPLISKLMSSTQLRVFLLFSAGYFVSYVFRGVNLGFAPFITHDLGLSATDLGLLTPPAESMFGPRNQSRVFVGMPPKGPSRDRGSGSHTLVANRQGPFGSLWRSTQGGFKLCGRRRFVEGPS